MTAKEIDLEVRSIAKELSRLERSIKHAQASPTPFIAVGRAVMLGAFCVGKMKSNNYAIRTANALNAYKPNERGV